MKGARIMEFDKLREIIGDYQQLDFAKGAIELPLHCAETLDSDGLGKEYWQTVPLPDLSKPSDGQGRSNNAPDDPRRPAWERRVQCYDLILDSLETFENKVTSGDEITERVRAHAYELAFLGTDEIFHSRLYEWLISRGLADELLEVRKCQPFRVPQNSLPCRCDRRTFKPISNASREHSTNINFFGSSMSKTVNRSAPPRCLLPWQNHPSTCCR